MVFDSDHKAQPGGGRKADFSEAFGPTGNVGAGAEPPLIINIIIISIIIRLMKNHLTVRRPLNPSILLKSHFEPQEALRTIEADGP
jgi:hypothetical protein